MMMTCRTLSQSRSLVMAGLDLAKKSSNISNFFKAFFLCWKMLHPSRCFLMRPGDLWAEELGCLLYHLQCLQRTCAVPSAGSMVSWTSFQEGALFLVSKAKRKVGSSFYNSA